MRTSRTRLTNARVVLTLRVTLVTKTSPTGSNHSMLSRKLKQTSMMTKSKRWQMFWSKRKNSSRKSWRKCSATSPLKINQGMTPRTQTNRTLTQQAPRATKRSKVTERENNKKQKLKTVQWIMIRTEKNKILTKVQISYYQVIKIQIVMPFK